MTLNGGNRRPNPTGRRVGVGISAATPEAIAGRS